MAHRLLDGGKTVAATVLQTLGSEELAIRVLGLGYAVGDQQQAVTGLQLQACGVELDGARVSDVKHEVDLTKAREFLLRAGKKKFLRIVVG